MSGIQRNYTNRLKNYFNRRVFILLVIFMNSCSFYSQSDNEFREITLVDTIHYIPFGVDRVYDHNYPPSALFDGDLKTCWVAGSSETNDTPALYLRIAQTDHQVLNFYSGYGKSEELYAANSRPAKLKLSIWIAVQPVGFITEQSIGYHAIKFNWEKTVSVADSFMLQSVALDFPEQELSDFQELVQEEYSQSFPHPIAGVSRILKVEVIESHHGTRYDDICISELFFNDRLVIESPDEYSTVKKAYLNPEENMFLIDKPEQKGIVVFEDTSSVLQIIEISDDKNWAILISMPEETNGRAETYYLLADLQNQVILNTQLEKVTGNYLLGNPKFFEDAEIGHTVLTYYTTDLDYQSIELLISSP